MWSILSLRYGDERDRLT